MKKNVSSNPRHYIAFCDNGHDYFEVHFESFHRANSKANLEDAKTTIHVRHGRKPGSYDIIETRLEER